MTFVDFAAKGMFEDNKRNEDLFNESSLFRDVLKKDIICLPCTSVRDGIFKLLIVSNHRDVSLGAVNYQMYPKPRIVDIQDRAELELKFYECQNNNYFMIWASDPMRMRLGFICLTHDDSVWYSCPINGLSRDPSYNWKDIAKIVEDMDKVKKSIPKCIKSRIRNLMFNPVSLPVAEVDNNVSYDVISQAIGKFAREDFIEVATRRRLATNSDAMVLEKLRETDT